MSLFLRVYGLRLISASNNCFAHFVDLYETPLFLNLGRFQRPFKSFGSLCSCKAPGSPRSGSTGQRNYLVANLNELRGFKNE
jgi:hypothetical protein